MSYLSEIKDFVQKLTVALSNSLEFHMSIIGDDLVQVSGTGRYETSVGMEINHMGIMHMAVLTKKLFYVENPRENELCYGCTMRETTCRETASLGYPILLDDKAIGAIGINCFTGEERIRLIRRKASVITILEVMAELIVAKVMENLSIQETKKQNESIAEVLDCMTCVENSITFDDIVGNSSEINQVKEIGRLLSGKGADVLINGENGTGKEMFARAIHSASDRSSEPFVSINCATIPQDLLEIELLGNEGGSLSNKRGKIGKLELANRGTLFLDEIEGMPLYLQAKLLRVLESRVVEKADGNKPIPLDIRIISATNRNLQDMISNKVFREDLFYKLNEVSLKLPPLRERPGDIEDLILYFLNKYNKRYDANVVSISPNAWEVLKKYSWPGNVRQLENFVQYLCCVYKDQCISKSVILRSIPEMKPTGTSSQSRIVPIEILEKQAIIDAIGYYGADTRGKMKAAYALGIGKSTLYRKLREYDIEI